MDGADPAKARIPHKDRLLRFGAEWSTGNIPEDEFLESLPAKGHREPRKRSPGLHAALVLFEGSSE